MEKLKNNSKEMNTVVETFVIEETQELIYDNKKLDKWNKYVKDLGLQGQTEIVKPKKSPIPFTYMKQTLKNTFECLCPRNVDVKEYNITPIPIEILDLIGLSVKEDYFTKIEIWYDEKTPDPVCVGILHNFIIHKKGEWSQIENTPSFRSKELADNYISEHNLNGEPYNWENKYYLLGKWADVKHSFKELSKMAAERYITEQGVSLRGYIKGYQKDLEELEIKALERFGFGKNIDVNINVDSLPF